MVVCIVEELKVLFKLVVAVVVVAFDVASLMVRFGRIGRKTLINIFQCINSRSEGSLDCEKTSIQLIACAKVATRYNFARNGLKLIASPTRDMMLILQCLDNPT
jgi:hypothetical protein